MGTDENIAAAPPVQIDERPPYLRIAALALALLVLVATLIAYTHDLPIAMFTQDYLLDWLKSLVERARVAGLAGVVVVVLAYGIGVVVAAPSALMTYSATLVYGYWAIPITIVGATIGMLCAYILARFGLRNQIGWLCNRYPVTRGVEKSIAKNGFWIVFLLRQSPIVPFAAQNYMFGALSVAPRTYALGSILGIIPGTIAKVFIFYTANQAAMDPAATAQAYIFGAIGVLATIIVMWIIGRAVQSELRQTKAI